MWREWMMVGVGLTGLLAILAVIRSVVALASKNPTTATAAQATPSAPPASATPGTEAVKLTIKNDAEHGKRGPDGKWHDAYLPANFTVHAGDKVTVTVYNYDSMPHTFTSSTLDPQPADQPADPCRERERAQQDSLHLHRAIEDGQVAVVVQPAVRPVLDDPHRIHARIRDRRCMDPKCATRRLDSQALRRAACDARRARRRPTVDIGEVGSELELTHTSSTRGRSGHCAGRSESTSSRRSSSKLL